MRNRENQRQKTQGKSTDHINTTNKQQTKNGKLLSPKGWYPSPY